MVIINGTSIIIDTMMNLKPGEFLRGSFFPSFASGLGELMENIKQKKDSKSSTKTAGTHPYESANWFSRATVGWMNSILQLGSKRPLAKDDIFSVRTEDSMGVLVTKLESKWQQEVKRCLPRGCEPRLWKALVRMFSWKAYTLMIFMMLCRFLSTIALPMLMWFFLSEIEKGSQREHSKMPFVFVTGIAVLAFCNGFSRNHSSAIAEIWGNQLKASCIGLIYKKVRLGCIDFGAVVIAIYLV